MVEFISLLLGLVSGPHPVELSIVGPVAEVELRLDDRTVGVLDGPPWQLEVDFTERLEPHELVAVARDGGGQEIDRAVQWVNLQQRPAAATIAFVSDAQGHPRSARLVWESLGSRQPRSVEMYFDGQPLEVTDPENVRLPAYDLDQLHFVSATLTFADDVTTRIEAGFGGLVGGEIAIELTAVAVTLDAGASLPPPAELQGWFVKDGEPLEVRGVESSESEVVIVRDPEVQLLLEELTHHIEGRLSSAIGRRTAFGALPRKTFLRVLSPAGAPLPPSGVTREMFAHSASYDAASEGLLWLSQIAPPKRFPLLAPNAIALAGMQAHASTRRRAVVLMLGPSSTGEKTFSPEEARRYLAQMHVPLFVWALTPDPHPEWGEARDVDLTGEPREAHKKLRQAVAEVRASLERQHIVWLDGRHLPQSIELSPQATGIRLTGS